MLRCIELHNSRRQDSQICHIKANSTQRNNLIINDRMNKGEENYSSEYVSNSKETIDYGLDSAPKSQMLIRVIRFDLHFGYKKERSCVVLQFIRFQLCNGFNHF